MTNWTTLCAKFSEDEVKIIKILAKKFNVSKSKIIRYSVATQANAILFQALLQDEKSPLFKAYAPIVKKIFSKKRMKEIENEIEKLGKRPKIIKQAEEDAEIIYRTVKIFKEHKKRGKPKKPKKRRGRPKD